MSDETCNKSKFKWKHAYNPDIKENTLTRTHRCTHATHTHWLTVSSFRVCQLCFKSHAVFWWLNCHCLFLPCSVRKWELIHLPPHLSILQSTTSRFSWKHLLPNVSDFQVQRWNSSSLGNSSAQWMKKHKRHSRRRTRQINIDAMFPALSPNTLVVNDSSGSQKCMIIKCTYVSSKTVRWKATHMHLYVSVPELEAIKNPLCYGIYMLISILINTESRGNQVFHRCGMK